MCYRYRKCIGRYHGYCQTWLGWVFGFSLDFSILAFYIWHPLLKGVYRGRGSQLRPSY